MQWLAWARGGPEGNSFGSRGGALLSLVFCATRRAREHRGLISFGKLGPADFFLEGLELSYEALVLGIITELCSHARLQTIIYGVVDKRSVLSDEPAEPIAGFTGGLDPPSSNSSAREYA